MNHTAAFAIGLAVGGLLTGLFWLRYALRVARVLVVVDGHNKALTKIITDASETADVIAKQVREIAEASRKPVNRGSRA